MSDAAAAHPLALAPPQPMTEAEVRAATVGEPAKVPGGRVEVRSYDPNWPGLFDREADRLRAVLGDRVLLVQHVGSTSVPGLAAKPIIDIDLVVADSDDEAAWLTDLETAGYRLVIREPDWYRHRVLKGPDTNINLHVWSREPSAGWRRHRLFRDWLRADDVDRKVYGRFKQDLSARRFDYPYQYNNAKAELIGEIYARALAADAAAAYRSLSDRP